MQYRENPRNHQMLSALGYGCLRFSKKGMAIDQAKAEREMLAALKAGVNYFDTAYTYGGSEACLGTFLAKGYRDRVNIATKLPHYYVKEAGDMERYFQEQLKRLKTDHIEYYLMHMLNDLAAWERLKALGIEVWIAGKKETGQIQNIGFSFHGGADSFLPLVDAYDWDFCQIQYNYMDENAQAGRRGLIYASEKGLPVIIMEPLRGGRLVQGLPKTAKRLIARGNPAHSAAEWGLKWLWNQPQVTVVLSGMNDMEQVKENVRIASETPPNSMTRREQAMIDRIKGEINTYVKVPCTGCGYCMPCPRGVDIPVSFQAYNTSYTDSWFAGIKAYFMCHALRERHTGASECVKCGMCQKKCPQHIGIPKMLERVKRRMENPVYRLARWAAGRIGKY